MTGLLHEENEKHVVYFIKSLKLLPNTKMKYFVACM